MADHGCIVLQAGDITAGTVSVTPATTPTDGTARVVSEKTMLGKTRVASHDCVVAVNGNNLDITLEASDRTGQKLWWWSID